ncbi:MAG TPA: TetR/AcrR family transcriptional regulator [Nitrospiria bacterium]|nr:TetR/AcrR family transcriptional regulator [Nitrospiria bacterium]
MGEKGEMTRSRIVETAKTLFHLKGFTNTSMDDIVRESGITKGNLYYYFSSKEELGNAVIEQWISDAFSRKLYFPKKGDPVRQIMAMFRRIEKEMKTMECRGGCPFGNLAVEVSDLHDGLRKKLEEAFSRWVKQLEEFFETHRRQGVLRPDIDSKSAARFVVATLEGGILLSKVKRNVQVFKNCTEMMRQFLEGLRVHPTSK